MQLFLVRQESMTWDLLKAQKQTLQTIQILAIPAVLPQLQLLPLNHQKLTALILAIPAVLPQLQLLLLNNQNLSKLKAGCTGKMAISFSRLKLLPLLPTIRC
jgi:hypothetical protein